MPREDDMVARSTDEKGWMYWTIALVLIKSMIAVRCGAMNGLSNKVGWMLVVTYEIEHGRLTVAFCMRIVISPYCASDDNLTASKSHCWSSANAELNEVADRRSSRIEALEPVAKIHKPSSNATSLDEITYHQTQPPVDKLT